MKDPRQIYKALLVFGLMAIGVLLSTNLRASHIVGGELTYKYLGNDTFLIVLDVYRDCGDGDNEGWDMPHPYIGIFTEDGQYYGSPFLNNDMYLNEVSFDTLPNNIAGDPCLFIPPNVCVEHGRYQNKFRLPSNQGYYITYQRCCRNKDVLNILNSDQVGANYWVYISPQANSLGNSSPYFGYYPPVFVCVNYPIEHPYAAIDPDGDSLVYKFYTPSVGGLPNFSQPKPDENPYGPPYALGEIQPPPYQTVEWNTPLYDLDHLLGIGSDPLSVDLHTGLITGLPQIQGRFVVGVIVEEYRNGQLLSVVRRDFQYVVGVCAELDVKIVAPDAQCDNLTVDFGNDTEVAENFIWYFDWPNLTPTSIEREPTFTFSDTGSYTVALIAEPVGFCVDTAFHQIYLQNNSLTTDFSWQTYDCVDQSVLTLQDLSQDYVSPVTHWNWTVAYGTTSLNSTQQNPVFQIPNPSSGTISLTARSVNGCEQTKTVAFSSGGNPGIGQDTVGVCLGDIAFLNPNGASSGFTFQWGAGVPTGQQNAPNPMVFITQNTDYLVTVTGFAGLCESVVKVHAKVYQPVDLAFELDTDCDAKVVNFVNQSENAPFGYVWQFGDPTNTNSNSTQPNPTYVYPSFGNYSVALMTAPNAVCKDTLVENINLSPKTLEPGFGLNYIGCEEDSLSIRFYDQTVNSEDDTNGWEWTFEGVYTGTDTVMNPVITVTEEGWLLVTLKVTTSENCIDSTATDSLLIDFTELPNLPDSSEVIGCLNGGVCLNPGGDTTYIYNWMPAIPGCDSCASPCVNPSQTTVYNVEILNPNGADTCSIFRQITVVVPPDVHLQASEDSILTCEQFVTLHAMVDSLPVTFAWFNSSDSLIAGNVDSVTVLVSGIDFFVVRATDTLGCHYYDTIHVAGGPPNIDAGGPHILCSTDSLDVFAVNLDQNDTLTWQWSPIDLINGPSNVPDPDVPIVSGEHWLYVEATNQFGCTAIDSVYLAVVDTSNVLDFSYEVECNGSAVQFINTSTNAFNFFWEFGDPSSSSDTSNLDNPSYTYPGPGTYTVLLTMDFDLACVDTLVREIELVTTQFVPDFTYEYVNCSTDSIAVQFHDATTIFQTGVSIDSFFWETSNGDTSSLANPIFTVYAGQDFEVTMNIFTSNDCNGSETKELKLEFIEVNLEDSIVLCLGDTVALNPFGNTDYLYSWSPDSTISDIHAANPLVWPSQTTTYTVEITNFSPDTCSITKEVLVIVPTKIEVTASNDTLTCGAPVLVCANANLQPVVFQWFAIPGGPVGSGSCLNVLPSADTEYEVTATDQYGCFDKDTVFVADESVNLNWQNAGAECPETEIPLTVNNLVSDHDLSYVWTATPPGQIIPPANGTSVIVLTPPANQAAIYTVTATNQFGCTASLSQTIFSYDFVPNVTDSLQVCSGVGEPLNPNGNTSYNYTWSPATGLSPGPNVPNPTVTATQSTIYTANITGNFGFDQCQTTVEVEVFVPPLIEISATPDTITCGDPIQLTAQTNVPVTIVWTNAAGTVLGGQNTLTVDPDGTEIFTISATDNFGCIMEEDILVANRQLDILISGGGVIDTCPMPSYNLCVTNLDLSDFLMFEWSATNGGQIVSGGTLPCAEVTSEQGIVSHFEVIVSNQWGCSSTEEFEVTTYVFDPIASDRIDICPGVPTPINQGASSSPLIYSWSPPIGLNCYDCPNPIATFPGDSCVDYTVTIQGYHPNDTCSYSQTVQVCSMPWHELVTNPTDSTLCDTVDVLLSASYTSIFVNEVVWAQNMDFSNPIGMGNTVLVTPIGTQFYYVQTTDTLGCHDTAQVVIDAYPVDISIPDTLSYCEEIGTLTIPVTNYYPDQPLTFVWSPMTNISAVNPDGSAIVTGLDLDETYHLEATNAYGCSDLDTSEIFYYDIEASLGQIASSEDTIYYNSGEFSQLGIDEWPGYVYEWSPADGLDDPFIHNPKAEPDQTTTYTVLVTDGGGCQATREVTIVVLNPDCDEPYIFLPNAFSPNGSGKNDVLYLRSNIVDEMELSIYNRWGQRVFYTQDQSIGWDGTFNGIELAPDVYGFYLRAKCYNAQEFFKKGNISLIR